MIRAREDGNSLDATACGNSQAALAKRSKTKFKDGSLLEFRTTYSSENMRKGYIGGRKNQKKTQKIYQHSHSEISAP